MISIGIDLSLTGTGIVILEDGKIKRKESIKSKPIGKKPIHELTRIKTIVASIYKIIEVENKIDVAVIENLAFGIVKTTSLTQLAGLSYFVRDLLAVVEIPFIMCAPTTLKKFATGRGNSPKDNVMMEIYKRWHVTITDNNIADAFILAKIGHSLLEEDTKLTIPQREVIKLLKVQL